MSKLPYLTFISQPNDNIKHTETSLANLEHEYSLLLGYPNKIQIRSKHCDPTDVEASDAANNSLIKSIVENTMFYIFCTSGATYTPDNIDSVLEYFKRYQSPPLGLVYSDSLVTKNNIMYYVPFTMYDRWRINKQYKIPNNIIVPKIVMGKHIIMNPDANMFLAIGQKCPIIHIPQALVNIYL